jgi:hypothetical protein
VDIVVSKRHSASIFSVEAFWVVTPCNFVGGYKHSASIFRVEAFWVVTMCNFVGGFKCFKGTFCLRLQGEAFWADNV